MAGATNRALKAAGLPKATIKTLRVEGGGRLNLRSAIAVAHSKGLDTGKAVAHLERRDAKAAVKAQATAPQPATRAVASRKGGAAPGRISDLRRVPILRNAALDVRATPTVLKEYFAPNLSGVAVGRRQRMARLSDALVKAVANAPPGATTVRFQVGALGEGGVRGSGQYQRLDFKARLLKGKGDGGKDMVALNVVGGSRAKQADAARAQRLRGEANLTGRGVVREGGALRIKSRGDASVPFRHRGETVYAAGGGGTGKLVQVVRSDGSIVRNSEAIKRAARVVRAVVSRQKAGPSPAMKRGEAARAKAAAANTEAARRAALVAASSARRNRTNPTAIRNQSGSLYGAEASFSHRGQQYRVRHTAGLGTDIRTASGASVPKPKKALKQRAQRVISAVAARVKSGGKGVASRVRAADEY